MALEIRLSQKLSQTLMMTPQLQQAIKLLQLGRQEYIEEIQKELLENPILEELAEEEGSNRGPDAKTPAETIINVSEADSETPSVLNKETSPEVTPPWEEMLADFSDYSGSASPKGLMDSESRPSLEATLTRGEDLVEHVLSQLRYEELSPEQRQIVQYLAGNLDRDGYLTSELNEVVEACKCTLAQAEEALKTIQGLDPLGIGARNLGECLLIQLADAGLEKSLAATIVRQYLDKLQSRHYEQIAKAERVPLEEVYQAVNLIQHLEPKPGRIFWDDETRYIVPDVYVYKDGTDYVITLNEDGLPKLRVSSYYLNLMQDRENHNNSGRAYLTERLKAASWLIRSIHQRQQTIYRVTESIVKFQRDFLEHGIEKLKPLVLKDVADDINMHESTVSRVTTNKYVHTPQGVYELKFFFTTGIKVGNSELSSSSIKEKIKNLIAAEDPKQPISDQEIVEILQKDSIDIARRTVAKYREGLGILASSKRKRVF